ncbi:hypothetical protein PM082_010356 [Marasmius tenuissimus]|nr:hypothetical protein PM082_010356 [Marasmius tenuissimus]
MTMFCLPLRFLSLRHRSTTVPKDRTRASAKDDNTKSRSSWMPPRNRRVLQRRRSKATSTASASSTATRSSAVSDDQPLTAQLRSTGDNRGISRNRSVRRGLVLTWKRMNQSSCPRKSQRFSSIPPDFVLVSRPTREMRVLHQNQDDQ